MKLRKILISILILLLGSTGLLFGCNEKPLKLSAIIEEEIVECINLKLPIDGLVIEEPEVPEEPENPENPETEEGPRDIPSSQLVTIKGENINDVFKEGLDFYPSENNIVNIQLKEILEDGYVYEISALYPKNVIVTFETKDKKTKLELQVVITQDILYIESNPSVKNYVVFGKNQEISTNIINFEPSTTTSKNIKFALSYSYEGIMIDENNNLIFDPSITEVMLNNTKQEKIYIDAIHENYETASVEDKSKFIVERIEFDVLEPIGDIKVLSGNNSPIDSLEFATNSQKEELNYRNVSIKEIVLGVENNVTYKNIHSSYEVEYYIENDKQGVVNIEKDGNNEFVISQNFRDDSCTIVFVVKNKLYPQSESKTVKVNVNVKTYPSYITINGHRQASEVILYDTGSKHELEIIVGPDNAYNKTFMVTSMQMEVLSLKYENGVDVKTNNDRILSGTKLYLSYNGNILTDTNSIGLIEIKSADLDNTVTTTIPYRIVKNLKEEDLLIDGSSSNTQFTLSKIDELGNNTIKTFALSSNLYIPSYSVEVYDENIVKLENINYSQKTFSIKALSTGSTLLELTFENGLTKILEVSIYMPIDHFKLDIDETSKVNNIGDYKYSGNNISNFALKLNRKATLIIKPYDSIGNLINDKNIYTVVYSFSGNNENITIDNVTNEISALQKTNQDVQVTASITYTNKMGLKSIYTLIFSVSVYVPIDKITINDTYVSLFTSEDLGAEDINLSKVMFSLNVVPANASNFIINSPKFNFESSNWFTTNSTNRDDGLDLEFTANSLDGGYSSYTGTINFTVQEFSVVYTKKVTIKITRPVTPTNILLDNIQSLEVDGNKEDYLYFNLGYTNSVSLNPRVYPLNSYNLDYDVKISDQTSEGDPISFDKATGVITPVMAGECVLEFIPKGSYKNSENYISRKIKIFVADGSIDNPYQISSKQDFISLCSTNVINSQDKAKQDEKYTKNYVLTKDIDLTGESILPIGVYISQGTGAQTNYNFRPFTGSFSGEFKINNLSKSCTISGISIDISKMGELFSYINNQTINYGLFATNAGTIKNLNISYSSVKIIATAATSEALSITSNNNLTTSFYFGGVAGINAKTGIIENCNVDLLKGEIISYFKSSYIGLVCGKNENEIISSRVTGNLNVLDGISKYNKDRNSNQSLRDVCVGGISGENLGKILDDFNVYDPNLKIFSKEKISSTLSLTSIYLDAMLETTNNSAFGLISGKNQGSIGDNKANTGVSSYGKIIAYTNVGAIAGINSGSIFNSFTASTLSAYSVVGGLVGLNTNGTLKNNAVMFLEDENLNCKISGYDYVAGLIGKLQNEFNGSKNFVKSFVSKDGFIDVNVLGGTNYGAIYSGNHDEILTTDNFADFTLGVNGTIEKEYNGSISGVGINAPESIEVLIKESNLFESTIGKYNKFIKADENSIILYFYLDNLSLNEYLINSIFNINEIYKDNQTSSLSLIQVQSLNKEILDINEHTGKIIVNKCGDVKIHFYSLLNKNAEATINVKIVDKIDVLNFHIDSLSPSLESEKQNIIKSSYKVEKDKSFNLYLDEFVKQKDVYISYQVSDEAKIQINSTPDEIINENGNEIKLYKTLNSQVFKGLDSGTISITASLYVKYGENLFKMLPLQKSFNLIVYEGLNNLYLDVNQGVLVLNSGLDASLSIDTDLISDTNVFVTQKVVGDTENCEYLNIISERNIENNELRYNFKMSLDNGKYSNSLIGKTIQVKIYTFDSFVLLDTILDEEENGITTHSNYIKTIDILIEENNLVNLSMSYFADGEVIKDEYGNDVINVMELESEYIKIGKIGILKINVYPFENLQNLSLTYTNLDGLNLNFKQVRKNGDYYVDVNTAILNSKGINLDLSEENVFEGYVFVKLLTDSPIKENSVFTIKAMVNENPYYFEKHLTSKLATNLEIYYKNALLNSNGILEGVYAKGVTNSQVISVTANKLSGYELVPVINANGINSPALKLISTQKINEDVVTYNYIVEGLINSGEDEYAEIYFYIDKIVNQKKERYISNTLKLNIVDFVVNSISIENVVDGYLTKPLGTDYELKVNLQTTNNGSASVLNQIKDFENEISKSNIWFENTTTKFNELKVGEYSKFNILKQNGYYILSPKDIFKGYTLSSNFSIVYNQEIDGKVQSVGFKNLALQDATNEVYIENGKYSNKFRVNFGLDIYLQTDINNPVPIYSQEDFVDMKAGANYILMNNLELNDYTIQTADFASLDGNGYKITIKSVKLDLTNIQNSLNFGLFSEISQNTLVKNLTVALNLNTTVDSDLVVTTSLNLTNVNQLNFGAIAGVNKGLIYNCYVAPYVYNNKIDVININTSNILNNNQTIANIGTFVGENNGFITNSRSEMKISVNRGFVGGFVANNTGSISSSFYKNSLIINLGEDEKTSATSGFVNKNTGSIKYSYVEGEETRLVDGVYTAGDLSSYNIISSTGVGGFVYSNEGNIEDCYSNLSLTSQSFSGGFVYTNNGKIVRSYSATVCEKESEAHAPFIATRNIIDEKTMKELIVDCFYLDNGKSSINDNLVSKLTLKQFNDEYYLTNFVIDLANGIWTFRNGSTPTLIEANNIAFSQRKLYNSYVDQEGSTIYNYIYTSGYFGHSSNPIIISSEEEFINYFTLSSTRNSYYYRLINNINFSEYSNLPTIYYSFSGRLDGNGLEISNISISAPSNFTSNSFGLFSKIEKYSSDINPIVKNLNLKPLEVYANNVQKVGALAGYVKDSDIINVNVQGNNVIVQGRNLVGGVVGEVVGDSKIINITSNMSTNASFASNRQYTYIYDSSLNEESEQFNKMVSYSGSICGAVNTTKTTNGNENVRNIVVLESTKSIGTISGLAFGVIAEESGIDNVKVYVDSASYVNSIYTSGLVVGENRGYISRTETLYSQVLNKEYALFKNTAFVIGGIVGFNNNGTIVNSIARVSTVSENPKTLIAGGVVGMSVGGSISSVVAINNVYAKDVIGGIIGLSANKEMLTSFDLNEDYYIEMVYAVDNIHDYENDAIAENYVVYISNTVALNDFSKSSLKDRVIGALIGGAHNTLEENDEGEMAYSVKNSYITHNNFYLDCEYTFYDEFTNDYITEKIQDFGASGYNEIGGDGNGIRNREDNVLQTAGKVIDSATKNVFNYFSSNVFENLESNYTTLLNRQIPILKSTNNINTKTLEGDGTHTSPYQVNSVMSLNQLSSLVSSGKNNVYVIVTDNIEATGKEIQSIGNGDYAFNGTFNGNNKFINGLTYINDEDKYSTQNFFGLFGLLGRNAFVTNVNVVANFVINYGSSVTYTGAIAGINNGQITNTNVYGGIVGIMKNADNATSYVGGVAGLNSGLNNTGIANSNNYALISVSVVDEDNININANNINIYAGFIAGANLNGAIINICNNYRTSNIELNQNDGDYTLVVINNMSTSCNNYVGNMCGYSQNSNVVEGEGSFDNIYSKANNTYKYTGKSSL